MAVEDLNNGLMRGDWYVARCFDCGYQSGVYLDPEYIKEIYPTDLCDDCQENTLDIVCYTMEEVDESMMIKIHKEKVLKYFSKEVLDGFHEYFRQFLEGTRYFQDSEARDILDGPDFNYLLNEDRAVDVDNHHLRIQIEFDSGIYYVKLDDFECDYSKDYDDDAETTTCTLVSFYMPDIAVLKDNERLCVVLYAIEKAFREIFQ